MIEFFKFSGRSSRLSYAWGTLPIRICYLLLLAVLLWCRYGFAYEPNARGLPHPVVFDVLLALVSVLFLVAEAPLDVRRLHDLGRRGVHYWLLLVPIYGIWLQLVMFFRRGQPDGNAFGDDPKITDRRSCVLPACFLALVLLVGCAIWTITAFGPFLKVSAVVTEGTSKYANVGILDSILRFPDPEADIPEPEQVQKVLGRDVRVTHMMQAPVFIREQNAVTSSQVLSFSATQNDLAAILGKYEIRSGSIDLTDDMVILGAQVASRLYARAGDEVLLRSISGERQLRIAGVIDTSTSLDESAIVTSATLTNLLPTARPMIAIASHGSPAINRLPDIYHDSRAEVLRMDWMANQDGPRVAAERASIQMVVAFAHAVWVCAALLGLIFFADPLCHDHYTGSAVKRVLMFNCIFLGSSFCLAIVGVLGTLPLLLQLFGENLYFLDLPSTFFWAALWGRLFGVTLLCLLASSLMAVLVARSTQTNNPGID